MLIELHCILENITLVELKCKERWVFGGLLEQSILGRSCRPLKFEVLPLEGSEPPPPKFHVVFAVTVQCSISLLSEHI